MLDAGCTFASAGDCIKIWDATSDYLHLNTHYTTEGFTGTGSSSFKDVSWNPSNTRIASVSNGNGIILYNFQEGVKNEGRELEKSKEQTALCFGNTDELYSGGATGDVNQWNCATLELIKTFPITHGSAVRRLTKIGERVVSASATGEIFIWDTSTSSVLTKLNTTKPKSLRGLQYSKYNKAMLGTTSDDGLVSLWDIEKETVKHSFTSHSAPAMDLSFSTINALLLVSGGLDKKIIFYDVQAQNIVKTITSVQPITSVCFLGNGMHVCAGTSMGNILLYDLRNNAEPLTNLHGHCTSVQRLVLQTLKERKRSSRSSSSKAAEKRTPKTKQDGTIKQSTVQPSNQRQTTKKSHETPNTRSSENTNGPERIEELSKSLKTPQSSAHVPNENTYPQDLHTPAGHGVISSDRDTMGSYCEQLFSPLGSVNGSLQNESIQQRLFPKSRQPMAVNTSRLNIPPTPRVTSKMNDVHIADEVCPNGQHTPTIGNHMPSGNGETSTKYHKPLSSSTPANAVSQSGPSECHDESIALSQQLPDTIRQRRSTLAREKEDALTFQYQLEFLKNTVHELVQDHEENMRDELRHLHVQVIKMFAEQNEVIRQLAEQCSVNPLLLQEIERLREENDRLRRKF